MAKLDSYLQEYKNVADSWLKDNIAFKHYGFIKDFFNKDRLETADWDYMQALGDYIHAFNALAIAKANAFGRDRAPIEQYRKVFLYLAHGDDPPEIRARNFMENKEYDLPWFGESAKSEIIGYVFPDLYMIKNKRDEEGLKILGIMPDYSRGDSLYTKFEKYTHAMMPVIEAYKTFVGRKTNLPLNLEVDQFFSWLYETYGKRSDIVISNEQIGTLMERFNEIIDNFIDFKNPGQLAEIELTYKHLALKKFDDFGGAQQLSKMIADGNALEAVNSLRNIAGLNLTHYTSWQRTFGTTEEQASALLSAFIDSASKPYIGPESTATLFNIHKEWEIPALWDLISNVLWALNPNDYWPIKISLLRKLAIDLGIQISGQGRPDPKRYDEVMRFGQAFKSALESWSPRDMTDVQSFLWVVMNDKAYTGQRSWMISPGREASQWDEFQNNGIIAIGWDYLGDLRKYANQSSILDALTKELGSDTKRTNSALACFEFAHVMKKDDLIFVKKGGRKLLGYGKILSDYQYDENRSEYKHTRKVEWINVGEWDLPEDKYITIKTLTDFTKYPDYVDFMKTLMRQEEPQLPPPQPDKDASFYWLNANPSVWDIRSFNVGEKQSYSLLNENGNPRRIQKYFQEVKPGDILIGYTTSPDRMITTICKVTQGRHGTAEGEEFEFEIQEQIKNGVTWAELQTIDELSNAEPLQNHQGSLFKLTKDEFDTIRYLIDERNSQKPPMIEPYTREKALNELFIDGQTLDEILFQLRRRKNIILQGPPGVGKTYVARRLAWLLIGEKSSDKIEMIQFHQSYSYEDFMQGYRPNEHAGFDLKNGIFMDFCLMAQREPGKPFVFVIDEINRGNLSRIFGELMMLIEADKRGKDFSLPLTYAKDRDERFYIPDNLHFIGTMNTADRSLALVDYALRRRFIFFDLEPAFNMPKFRNHLNENSISKGLCNTIIERISDLNSQITNDTKNLGQGFQIGHSYFCPHVEVTDEDSWYQTIIKTEIEPLLKEYWFDDETKVKRLINGLLNG